MVLGPSGAVGTDGTSYYYIVTEHIEGLNLSAVLSQLACVCMFACMYVCMYVVCMYVCMYVCG